MANDREEIAMEVIVDQGKWGICGFVSVLNAMYEDGKLKQFGRLLTLEQIRERLGAEVITYLKMTSVERPGIAAEILAYTKTFGTPYSSYTSIDDICRRIDAEMRVVRAPDDWANNQGGIGVAMPINALEDYIKFAGLKFKRKTIGAPAFTGKELLKHINCVIGCGRDPKGPPTSDGLRHWIYVNSQGILQNWGKKYDLKRVALPTMNYQYIPYVVELK